MMCHLNQLGSRAIAASEPVIPNEVRNPYHLSLAAAYLSTTLRVFLANARNDNSGSVGPAAIRSEAGTMARRYLFPDSRRWAKIDPGPGAAVRPESFARQPGQATFEPSSREQFVDTLFFTGAH